MKEITIGVFKKGQQGDPIKNARVIIVSDPQEWDYDQLNAEPHGVLIYYPDDFKCSFADGKVILTRKSDGPDKKEAKPVKKSSILRKKH